MSEPSNGITAEVIRSVMPSCQLSPDLLQATPVALPRPPQDAITTWRHARIARRISHRPTPESRFPESTP